MEDYKRLTLGEAIHVIAQKRVMIVCHVNPDGDAIGSAYGLLRLVELTGGSGRVICPSEIPERLRFLCDGDSTAYESGMENDFDIIVAVDTASASQLGELSHLAREVALSIDHHENCTMFADNLWYPDAAAAGVIVYDLAIESALRGYVTGNLSPVLRRVFAAIASDTGSFKFANTNESAFSTAAGICGYLAENDDGGDFPVDRMSVSDISSALFDGITKKETVARRIANKNLRYICGGKIAVTTVNTGEMTEHELELRDLGGMVDQVRGIEGTVCGVVIKADPEKPGTFRGSARSNVDFDVAAIAEKFGGGGHKRAAGFTITARSTDEAVEEFARVADAALAEYNSTSQK